MEKCYFCDSDRVETFAVRYVLCKKCSGIYTFNDRTDLKIPVALRLPDQKIVDQRPAIFRAKEKVIMREV